MLNSQSNDVKLRKVLNTFFPIDYLNSNSSTDQSQKPSCNLLRTTQTQNGTLIASSEPASRLAVVQARYQLNAALKNHQANVLGCCPIRRAIYEQCFDEVLRQVTVNCVERGLLLHCLRSELNLTLNYYRHLYESSVSFGITKSVQAEIQMKASESKIEHLEKLVIELKSNICSLERSSKIKEMNEFNAQSKLEKFYKSEIKDRDEIIKQQKNILKALTKIDETSKLQIDLPETPT